MTIRHCDTQNATTQNEESVMSINNTIADMSPQEVRAAVDALLKRERKEARNTALLVADLLIAELKVAGEPELSRQVQVILDTLRVRARAY